MPRAPFNHRLKAISTWIPAGLLAWLGATAWAVQVDVASGPLQPNAGCIQVNPVFCDLRIYQVMVEAFVDGDPEHDYTDGYGTSHHRGDLRGIIQSLDYIKDLGMNAIWLTPVFDSDAGEPQARLGGTGTETDLKLDATGYFTRDYFAIDPRFGTLDDARELVDEAHARGIYVLFDGVFGHHKGAPAPSPTGKLPVDSTDPADYNGNPAGYPGRVVDYDAPETLEFYTEVATWWIEELGIDGWRLDQAYQVPLPAWREIKAAVEAVSAARREAGEAWGTLGYMVAEIFAGAGDIAAQAFGPEQDPALDSAFDFPLRWATVGVLAGEESGLSRRPASTINDFWAYGAHSTTYRPLAIPNMMLGNHDFVRYGDLLQRAAIAGPEDPGYWARHRLAFMVQAAYSGPITRYYGEEIGDEVPGYSFRVVDNCANLGLCDDHVARTSGKVLGVSATAQDLGAEQHALLQFHRDVMAVRQMYPALSHGTRQHLYSDDELYLDLKTLGDRQVLFAMNVSDQAVDVEVSEQLFAAQGLHARDLLAGAAVPTEAGYLDFSLAPLSGRFILLSGSTLPEFNAGLNDAWFNLATAGQGFFITVFPSLELVFLSWFTFDAARPDDTVTAVLGEPGHRWLTALGRYIGNAAVLEVEVTRGGVFNTASPAPVQSRGGIIRIEFHSCNSATLTYALDDPPLSGQVEITRVVADNVALCQALAGQ